MTETATVTIESGKTENPLAWIKLNPMYFRTLPGIIKLVQLLTGIICMILASPVYISATHWFMFVVVISFIGTLIWVFVYLLSIREALTLPINWILSEVLNTGILAVLYFIAFIVQLSTWSTIRSAHTGVNIAAGVFGLFNTLAYGAGTYFLYAEWKTSTTQ